VTHFEPDQCFPEVLERRRGHLHPDRSYHPTRARLQYRLRLHVAEFRRQRLRGAVSQSARQHELRPGLRRRHRPQLSRPRLRRSDERRGRAGGEGLRGPGADVCLRVQRRRRPSAAR
jgi:hypothetical protein